MNIFKRMYCKITKQDPDPIINYEMHEETLWKIQRILKNKPDLEAKLFAGRDIKINNKMSYEVVLAGSKEKAYKTDYSVFGLVKDGHEHDWEQITHINPFWMTEVARKSNIYNMRDCPSCDRVCLKCGEVDRRLSEFVRVTIKGLYKDKYAEKQREEKAKWITDNPGRDLNMYATELCYTLADWVKWVDKDITDEMFNPEDIFLNSGR